MKKSELRQIIREEVKNILNERRGIDSHYLQNMLDDLIRDTKRNEPKTSKMLSSLKSRIEQSYPSGQVEREDVDDILNDPRMRRVVEPAGATGEYYIDSLFESKQPINELSSGDRVKLVYKGIFANDQFAKYFNGKTGSIMSKEDGYYRVKLDTPVNIPNVGKVTSDLWEKQFIKKIK